MNGLISVMLGSAIGAGGRYAIGLWLPRGGFPWATLTVNLAGGLAMGLLVGLLARHTPDEPLRLLLGAGVLGGFTTFSAFGLDTVTLIERGASGAALAYVTASVVGAIALTALGLAVARA